MKNIASMITEKDENVSLLCAKGATVTLFTFQVPSNAKMRITHFSNYINLVNTHWGHVTWSIKRNGVLVEPYGAITDELGLQYEPRKIARVIFHGGDTLAITASDDDVEAQPPNLIVGIALRFEVM